MSWTCSGCGIQGSRTDDAAAFRAAGGQLHNRVCQRTGICVIGGTAQCCVCAAHNGWLGIKEYGCSACLKVTGVRPGPLKRAAAVKMESMWSTMSKPSSSSSGRMKMGAAPIKMFEHVWTPKPVIDKKIKATKLAVFDFDACLFRTPDRPSWWPFNSYETMMESLKEPVVPQLPTKDWFDPEVMARLAQLSAQEDVWKVLVTFRAKPFFGRILEILSSAGISFDEVRCRPLCSCCNPLGMSQTGSAGYGDLKIARSPVHPEDRHRLVHTANLVSEMPKVSELEVWLPRIRADMVSACLCLNPTRTERSRHIPAEDAATSTDSHSATSASGQVKLGLNRIISFTVHGVIASPFVGHAGKPPSGLYLEGPSLVLDKTSGLLVLKPPALKAAPRRPRRSKRTNIPPRAAFQSPASGMYSRRPHGRIPPLPRAPRVQAPGEATMLSRAEDQLTCGTSRVRPRRSINSRSYWLLDNGGKEAFVMAKATRELVKCIKRSGGGQQAIVGSFSPAHGTLRDVHPIFLEEEEEDDADGGEDGFVYTLPSKWSIGEMLGALINVSCPSAISSKSIEDEGGYEWAMCVVSEDDSEYCAESVNSPSFDCGDGEEEDEAEGWELESGPSCCFSDGASLCGPASAANSEDSWCMCTEGGSIRQGRRRDAIANDEELILALDSSRYLLAAAQFLPEQTQRPPTKVCHRDGRDAAKRRPPVCAPREWFADVLSRDAPRGARGRKVKGGRWRCIEASLD